MPNKTDKPLVSIITPVFNTAQFLQECIESVVAQTYPNWEFLLVDDGSSDGSVEIAKQYAAQYPGKILYLEHENHQNRGASASRNLGIQTAKGKYIAFLDSDDIYLPKKLEDQVALFNAHPEAAMLYSSTEWWYSWTGQPEDAGRDWVWDKFGVTPNTVIEPPNLLTTFLKDGGTIPCMGSILVKKEAIEAVGGWENKFRYIYTDQVFHAKICFNWPVLVVSGCWDRYRQHPDSACHVVAKTNQAYTARRNYLTWLRTYLIQQGGKKDKSLWKAFKRAELPYRYKQLKPLLFLFRKAKKKAREWFRAVVWALGAGQKSKRPSTA